MLLIRYLCRCSKAYKYTFRKRERKAKKLNKWASGLSLESKPSWKLNRCAWCVVINLIRSEKLTLCINFKVPFWKFSHSPTTSFLSPEGNFSFHFEYRNFISVKLLSFTNQSFIYSPSFDELISIFFFFFSLSLN